MAEIKTKPIRTYKGAFLFSMRTNNVSKAYMKQMSCGMVSGDICTSAFINMGIYNITDVENAAGYYSMMDNTPAGPAGSIGDVKLRTLSKNNP